MFIRSGYKAQTRSSRPCAPLSPPSGTENHHLTTRVVLGSRDRGSDGRPEPHLGRLTLDLGGKNAVKPDDVRFHRYAPVGRDRLPPSLEHESVTVGADRRRVAGVHDPIALTHVRH